MVEHPWGETRPIVHERHAGRPLRTEARATAGLETTPFQPGDDHAFEVDDRKRADGDLGPELTVAASLLMAANRSARTD